MSAAIGTLRQDTPTHGRLAVDAGFRSFPHLVTFNMKLE